MIVCDAVNQHTRPLEQSSPRIPPCQQTEGNLLPPPLNAQANPLHRVANKPHHVLRSSISLTMSFPVSHVPGPFLPPPRASPLPLPRPLLPHGNSDILNRIDLFSPLARVALGVRRIAILYTASGPVPNTIRTTETIRITRYHAIWGRSGE